VRLRPPRTIALALALGAISAVGVAGSAGAAPSIGTFQVYTDANGANCRGHDSCVTFRFQARDARLAPGARLRWRFIVLRVGDRALKTNQVDVFSNDGRVHRISAWPSESFKPGLYIARLIITGHGTTKSNVRVFRWY
jgi:hypothetical protein